MATMSLGVGLVLAAMVAEQVRRRSAPRDRLDLKPLAWASAALTIAGVLSLVVAELWPLSFGGHTAQVLWVRALGKLLYLFWPLVLAMALIRIESRQRERVLDVWIGTFTLLSLIAVQQFFTGWPRPQPIPTLPGRYHATLFLGHHLSVASVWIFPLFFALHRAVKRRKPLDLAAVALGTLTVFLTYSRMAWVALPAAITMYLLWNLKGRQRVLACVAVVVVGSAAFFTPAIQDRLGWKYGVWQRQELWRANEAFIQARPLTGVGFLSNQELSGYYLMELRRITEVFSGHAHNNVIDVLGGMGILGLLAWLFWWGRVGQILWKTPERKAWVCAVVAYQINGLTQVNFWEGKVFHTLAWVIAWALVSRAAR